MPVLMGGLLVRDGCLRLCVSEDKYVGVLRDVHVGPDLPSSKVAGGVQHMVQGPYM